MCRTLLKICQPLFKLRLIDIGKFSGTEATPSDELNFDQWCIDVESYQANYPDNILLPEICKSIIGKAKPMIQHLGPSYTVDEVITVLTQEYEGVASSNVIFFINSNKNRMRRSRSFLFILETC